MAILKCEINFGSGFVPVDGPKNAEATLIECVFNNGTPSATVQAISYEWLGDTAKKLNAYKNLGLSGGTGILEGPGLKISVNNQQFFEGCIDTANTKTQWECDRVLAPIKETGRIDWFNTISSGITWHYLKRLGIIQTSDYKKVPYTKTDVIDRAQLTMLFLQEIVMIEQLLKEVNDITAKSVTTAGGVTTEAATAALTTADLVADIINVVAEIVYLGTLIISIVLTANKIFDQIVQTKRYKYAMRVEDLMNKFCQYLATQGINMTFSSSIFQAGDYKDVTIMPRKIVMPKAGQSILSIFERDANEVNTSKSYGHPDGSVKEMIDALDVLFNSMPVVESNKIYLEEKNSYIRNSSYVLPDTGPEGYTFNYPDPHETNASKLSTTYELVYATDPSDLNTIHEYEGTSVEVNMLPIHVTEQRNLLLGGLTRKNISFAYARRKEYLNDVEQALSSLVNLINGTINTVISGLNSVISAIDNIVSWFGGSSTTIPLITYLPTDVMAGRIGWMELSADSFDIPKIFIGHDVGGDWHVHPNNVSRMSAINILNTFHKNELSTRGGQWKLYGDQKNTVRIKFCLSDYYVIRTNNYFVTTDSKKGKFFTLKWSPTKDIADASFGINEDFTHNLSETITIDGN